MRGFACFGSAGECMDDLKTLGDEALAELVRERALGLRALIEMLGESALGLQWSGGWELFRQEEQLFVRPPWRPCPDSMPC